MQPLSACMCLSWTVYIFPPKTSENGKFCEHISEILLMRSQSRNNKTLGFFYSYEGNRTRILPIYLWGIECRWCLVFRVAMCV